MISIVIVTSIVLAAIVYFPYVLGTVIRILPASWLMGGNQFTRDFDLRTRVVKTFLAGLADGLTLGDPGRSKRYLALDRFQEPFYIEGAYAGLRLGQYLIPWRSARALEIFRNQHRRFIFLLGIGSGFAGGLKTFWSHSTKTAPTKSLDVVDPRLRPLFFNGYAFQKMVFSYRSHPSLLLGGAAWDATERVGFYEGAGRALWFLVPDFGDLQRALSTLPRACVGECLIGFGIATGFAGAPAVAAGTLSTYPTSILESEDFRLGLIVGLFARYYTSPDFLGQLFGKEHPRLLNAVKNAGSLFDKLWERNVGYQEWRDALRQQLVTTEDAGSLFETMTTVA